VSKGAQELRGAKAVEEQEVKHQLKQINTEINSLKRKLKALEKQKVKLMDK